MNPAASGSPGGSSSRNAAEWRAADLLAYAAAPVFALMAVLTGISADGMGAMNCMPVIGSTLGGMPAMYLLMSVFHAGPWLRLVRANPWSQREAKAAPARH